MKAWRVTHEDFPDMVLIYAAETRNKATYLCLRQAGEAGYELAYTDARTVRAPEFDEEAIGSVGKCLGWKDETMSHGCLLDVQEVA